MEHQRIYLPKQINSPPYGESESDFKRLQRKNPVGDLYKTIRNLTPEQRVVVRKLGLGSLLELKINRLPSRLAFWLVERFDSNTGVLKVFDKEISITPELIRKTLDLPMGYLDVEDTNLWNLATPDPTHQAWKGQYPEGRRVSVANVADMIEKSSGDTGFYFILNFVVLFVSTMSNVSSDGTANASFLPSLVIDHEDQMNWSAYIMDHLKKGVKNWKEIEEGKKKDKPENFFIGADMLLQVIFANTLLKEPVFPALKFCTSKLLRELDRIMFGIDKFQKKTFEWAPYGDDADDTNYQFVFSAGSNESVEDADSVEANNFFQREPDIVDTECDLDTRSPVSASNTLSHGSASNFVASVLKASVETQENIDLDTRSPVSASNTSETSYAFSEPVMHGKKFVSNKSSINDGDSETSYAFSEPVMHGNYSPANNEEMPGDETTDKDERPNDKQKQNPSGPHNDPMTKETTDKDERPNDKQKQIYACTLVDVPQQTGCDDCGIYVCRSMEFPDDVMRFKKEEWNSEEERCRLAVRILRAQENSITRNNIDQVYSRRKNRVNSSAAEKDSITRNNIDQVYSRRKNRSIHQQLKRTSLTYF